MPENDNNIHFNSRRLISTLSGKEYPFATVREVADNGEPLEVYIPEISTARIRKGHYLWGRFKDFLPFTSMSSKFSLGEGNTALIKADSSLQDFTKIKNVFLKNETQNPTWSFKDRGSLTCVFMAREMGEEITATISTGNMGNSIAAYGARAGLKVVVFVPEYTPAEKINAINIHGATVFKVMAPDYSLMKKSILKMAEELNLRIVSGNGPIRVEGYKMTAFELYEQMGKVPDFIAVPTSACGHIRGLFKGYRELKKAGYIDKLPRMIVVQASKNCPIVRAIKTGSDDVIPFYDFDTVAEAITSGNPMGGQEIIYKAKRYNWLAEEVGEKEILESQKRLAETGFFVEPASATSLYAVKKLRAEDKIGREDTVVIMLTGAGFKDFNVFKHHKFNTIESNLKDTKDNVIRHFKL